MGWTITKTDKTMKYLILGKAAFLKYLQNIFIYNTKVYIHIDSNHKVNLKALS